MNKRKIFNDPLYGFITIHSDLIFDLIQHPSFQRLRRIKQLGLTDLVYPGANHTRFHHAIGAMYLMEQALVSLRQKGYEISNKEFEAALIAILLHDMGHGPFSHALENSILQNVHHEAISLLFMHQLNLEFNGLLSLAIAIFTDNYERHFFNQLVSSQLDIDRLDYLNRDSYFTGVSEGIVSADRLVRMFEIVNDEIAVQEKGVYSVENFLNARRLMYWQVYLHKTTICAEQMLIQIVRRARELTQKDELIFVPPNLKLFFENDFKLTDFQLDKDLLKIFSTLDDFDIWSGIKHWVSENDAILSLLCTKLLNRTLFKIILAKKPFSDEYLSNIGLKISQYHQVNTENIHYLRIVGELSNLGYIPKGKSINILKKTGELVDVRYASDLPNIKAISEIVTKYYICTSEEAFFGLFS